ACICFVISLSVETESARNRIGGRRRRFSYSLRRSSTYRRYYLSPHLLTESSVSVARPRRRISLSRRDSIGIRRFNSASRWLS
ncbi:unnamed protein product, partial [Brassica rapa subsp. narinosa]